MTNQNNQPIGIFDSGMGGLSVLSELKQLLPHEDFIYLGDTARLPYGTKSPHIVQQYALRVTEHLLNYEIKYLIIACNTASAFALDFLKQKFPQLPMIGVLEPGAKAATTLTTNKHIGIIATEATVNSGAYELAIHSLMPDATLMSEACQLLIPLVEEGWVNGTITDQIIAKYLTPFKQAKIDTLVLGCTHFPCLRSAIQKFMGDQVRLVDAHDTARLIYQDLEKSSLIKASKDKGKSQFLVTDTPERFKKISYIFDKDTLSDSTQIQAISL